MTPEVQVLSEVLGSMDASWTPLRLPDLDGPHANVNLYNTQRNYRTHGVPWRSSDALEADRKRMYRHLETMEKAGFLRTFDLTGERYPHLLLTDEAEALGRLLCDLPQLDETHQALSVLARFGKHRWVCETCCILQDDHGDYDSLGSRAEHRLWKHAHTMVPALARDLAVTRSTNQGHVFYLLRKSGWDFVKGPEPPRPTGLKRNGEAMRLYDAAWLTRRESLRHDPPPNGRDIGLLSLPVGAPLIRASDGCSDPPRRRKKVAR